MVSGHSIQECSVEGVSRLTLVHQTVDISLEAQRTIVARTLAGALTTITSLLTGGVRSQLPRLPSHWL